MNLDDRRADRGRRFDLHRFGGNEQRHANAGIGQPGDGAAQGVTLAGDIEPTFGRALLPPLGNHARGVRAHPARDLDHFRRRRHFEIERLADARLEPRDVVVDDVTAILAQVRGDAVGAGGDRDLRGLQRIGVAAAARVAHGRDMIDVDAEADGVMRRHRHSG